MVRLVASDFRFDGPATLPAGLVRLRLVNDGSDIHEALIVRLIADSGSAAAYVAAWRRGVFWPPFARDVGGTALTRPGDSSDVWLRLEPGRYVVICTKGDHLDRGMAADLTVTDPSGGSLPPPAADLELELDDYAFRFPARVAAGPHVVHVVNRGSEPHELDIYRVPPGGRFEDLEAWFDGGEQGLPPFETAGGGADLYPDHEEWISMALPPGHYLIVCTIRRGLKDDGTPHYGLGMRWTFEAK